MLSFQHQCEELRSKATELLTGRVSSQLSGLAPESTLLTTNINDKCHRHLHRTCSFQSPFQGPRAPPEQAWSRARETGGACGAVGVHWGSGKLGGLGTVTWLAVAGLGQKCTPALPSQGTLVLVILK